jgi:hypothetical protein
MDHGPNGFQFECKCSGRQMRIFGGFHCGCMCD